MRAGAKAGERPARWSESQESVNPDGTLYTFPLSGTSARSAETRIHGTTKRQVAAMFAEEQPALRPSPFERTRVVLHVVGTLRDFRI